jgi:hypothetical protein
VLLKRLLPNGDRIVSVTLQEKEMKVMLFNERYFKCGFTDFPNKDENANLNFVTSVEISMKMILQIVVYWGVALYSLKGSKIKSILK